MYLFEDSPQQCMFYSFLLSSKCAVYSNKEGLNQRKLVQLGPRSRRGRSRGNLRSLLVLLITIDNQEMAID